MFGRSSLWMRGQCHSFGAAVNELRPDWLLCGIYNPGQRLVPRHIVNLMPWHGKFAVVDYGSLVSGFSTPTTRYDLRTLSRGKLDKLVLLGEYEPMRLEEARAVANGLLAGRVT